MSHMDPSGINWPGAPEYQGIKPGMSFRIHNHGNTPARIIELALQPWFPVGNPELTRLPEVPPDLLKTGSRAFVVRGDSFSRHTILPISPQEITEIRNGERNLWILGYVDYIDAFHVRHRAGYARKYFRGWDKPGIDCLVIEAQEGYNYDIEIDEKGQPKKKRKGWRYYTGLGN